MQSVCRRAEKTETADGVEYRLTYLLTVLPTEGEYGDIFSITAILDTETGREEKTAYDITRIREKAEKLFDLISRNTVTPSTLIDTLSELL